MSNFRTIDRLFPSSVDEWLPEHLARVAEGSTDRPSRDER